MKKLVSFLILPTFFLTACGAEEVAPEAVVPDPVVKTMDLTETPQYEITEIGTLKAGQEVDLIAQSAGRISDLTVKLGDSVALDQTLALIKADETNNVAQINLNNAQNQLTNAEQSLAYNKANNQDPIYRAQLRVQSLNDLLGKLNRNLNELVAQNANTEQSLLIQRDTVNLNSELAQTTNSNLNLQLGQGSDDLTTTAKTTLDGIFVNLDSNLANINSLLNPDDQNSVSTSDIADGLGENDYSELSDAVDAYNNYRWNLVGAKANFEAELPLSNNDAQFALIEAKQRVDEMRILLAETREMLAQSEATESLPAPTLEAYRSVISGAEAATLGDLAKLDALSQSVNSFDLEGSTQLAGAQTSESIGYNQLAEADNALNKFYLTSTSSVNDLQAQIQQTQLDLQAAQADLTTAARTAVLMDSAKDLEVNSLNNQVLLAQNNVDGNKITSKLEGVISELTVENGDYVGPGTHVGKVIRSQEMTVVFYLSEENALRTGVGSPFTFSLADGQEYSGTIARIAPAADPINKKVKVEGVVENTGSQLKAETLVNVHLDVSTGTFDPNTLYIPMNAIIFGQNEEYVYVIENEMAIKKPIVIGPIFENWVEVVSGLNQGEMLIVEGQRNLPPEGGIKVNYGQVLEETPSTEPEGNAPTEEKITAPETEPETELDSTPEVAVPNADELLMETSTAQPLPVNETGEELYPIPENTNLGTK